MEGIFVSTNCTIQLSLLCLVYQTNTLTTYQSQLFPENQIKLTFNPLPFCLIKPMQNTRKLAVALTFEPDHFMVLQSREWLDLQMERAILTMFWACVLHVGVDLHHIHVSPRFLDIICSSMLDSVLSDDPWLRGNN